MSLSTAEDGYQPVPLSLPLPRPRLPGDEMVLTATMVRRPCRRRSSRAVLYLHCLHDAVVAPEQATWYLERGFHFYVADLRAGRARGRDATLAEYFGYLDAAARQARADGNQTILVSAHQAGAVIAALWCHARREAASADALVLADPEFGDGQGWLWRTLAGGLGGGGGNASGGQGGGNGGEAPRPAELLQRAQRRLRRGLDIACPVLVITPPTARFSAVGRVSGIGSTAVGRVSGIGSTALGRVSGAGSTTVGRVSGQGGTARWAGPPPRLGEHVTWLRLPTAAPSPAVSDRLIRKRRDDELRRWLGAYLASDVRDQLL